MLIKVITFVSQNKQEAQQQHPRKNKKFKITIRPIENFCIINNVGRVRLFLCETRTIEQNIKIKYVEK